MQACVHACARARELRPQVPQNHRNGMGRGNSEQRQRSGSGTRYTYSESLNRGRLFIYGVHKTVVAILMLSSIANFA